MSRRLILTGAALVAVLALAWTAGLQHQANCIDAGKVACSVLPWKAGEEPSHSGWGELQRKYGVGP